MEEPENSLLPSFTESFRSDHEQASSRVAQLRALRHRVKDTPAVQPDKSVSDTQPSALEASSMAVAVEDDRPAAVKRFHEIASVAVPIIESAQRVEDRDSPQIKKLLLNVRMEINKRIGQIANSRQQVGTIVYELSRLMSNAYNTHGHDFLNYCIMKIAMKIVDQAETLVFLHGPSAFPIAQLVVDLSIHQRVLTPVILHRMMTRCPYAVPRYVPKKEGQSDQAHKIAMGYLQAGNTIEGENAYMERMAGILSLYGAIVQTEPSIGKKILRLLNNRWQFTLWD